jgi:hypothetical protein
MLTRPSFTTPIFDASDWAQLSASRALWLRKCGSLAILMLRNQKSNAIGVAPILLEAACLEKTDVFTKLSICFAPVIQPEGSCSSDICNTS